MFLNVEFTDASLLHIAAYKRVIRSFLQGRLLCIFSWVR